MHPISMSAKVSYSLVSFPPTFFVCLYACPLHGWGLLGITDACVVTPKDCSKEKIASYAVSRNRKCICTSKSRPALKAKATEEGLTCYFVMISRGLPRRLLQSHARNGASESAARPHPLCAHTFCGGQVYSRAAMCWYDIPNFSRKGRGWKTNVSFNVLSGRPVSQQRGKETMLATCAVCKPSLANPATNASVSD